MKLDKDDIDAIAKAVDAKFRNRLAFIGVIAIAWLAVRYFWLQ